MKRLLLAFSLIPAPLFAQTGDIEVKTEVKEVTVYLSGAQETRTGKINAPAGNSTLRFSGLPGDIQPNSIQVKGVADFTIMSLNYQQNHLEEEEDDAEIKPLRDSVESLSHSLALLLAEKTALTEEKNMIQSNRRIVSNNGLVVDDLVEIAEHNTERIRAIETRLFQLRRQEEKLGQQFQKLNAQLHQIRNGRQRSRGEILVSINAGTKLSNSLVQISYLTLSSGWRPFYDIRSEKVGGPVQIAYKAHVQQSTGSDWNNVKVTLSTGNPRQGNTKPNVPVWYLDFASDAPVYDVRATSNMSYTLSSSEGKGYMSGQTGFTQITINAEFPIASAYSIPSDGIEYVVEIGTYDFETSYRYSSVPKVRQEAYLLARITGWTEYSMLPANGNIYFRGTFIGKSFLQTNTTKDTLDLSMGVDEGVVVQRKNVSEMQSKNNTGSTKKKKEEFEISVRNTKSLPIEIEIEDQVPVSTQKEITVEILETSGAEYNKETGKLLWKLSIPPGETKTIRLSYEVKYPKNFVIGNL